MIKNKQSFQKMLAGAFENLTNGNLEAAVVAFKLVLDQSPDHLDALHGLALTKFHNQQFESAKSFALRALSQDPLNASFLTTLGTITQHLSDYEFSIQCFKSALAINPENRNLRAEYILLLKSLGRNEEAEEWNGWDFNLVREKELLGRAVNLNADDKIDDAIKILGSLIDSRPNFVLARSELANIFQQQGRMEEFIEQLQMILKIVPTYAQAWVILGDNMRTLYRLNGSRNVVKLKLGQDIEGNDNALLLASARDSYEKALKIKPNHIGAKIGLAELVLEEGDLETAIDLLKSVLKILPSLFEVRCKLAKLSRLNGQFEEALNLFEEIKLSDSIARSNLIEMAMSAFNMGHSDQAEDSFLMALLADDRVRDNKVGSLT